MEGQTPAISPEHRRHVGMRIIKTVLAVFVCGVLAWARGESGFYSMIAAVVCVQNSAGKTIESSVNRMTGTLIGGVAGVAVVYLLEVMGILYIELARYAALALMLIPIIELCLLIKEPGSAAMACIVFLCVTVNHSIGDTPVIYSIERLFETLIGVALACGVDILLPYHTPAQTPADAAPEGASAPPPDNLGGAPEDAPQAPKEAEPAPEHPQQDGGEGAP